MATSGIYAITMTGTLMANAIGRLIGQAAVDMSDDLGSGPTAAIIQAVNMWILQQKGPPNRVRPGDMMWTREEASLTLTAKSTFDLKPSGGDLNIQIPVEILNANLKDTDGNENRLTPIGYLEYQAITPKDQTYTPTRFYYEKRLDTGKLKLDCIPEDITDVIDIVYRQPLEIINAAANEFDIEDWWYRAIKFNVALDVAPEFGSLDASRLNLIKERADEAMALVSRFNPDNTFTFFQPGMD